MSERKCKSLGDALLRGGDWNGIRVMGCGERLAVVAVSVATSLWLAPKIARHAVRHAAGDLVRGGEVRRDPGRDERGGEGHDKGVDTGEQPGPDAAGPAPEGAGFKRLAPRLRDDDGEQLGVVPVDLLAEEAPSNEVHRLGGRRIVQGIVVHDGGGQDAPENFAGRFVHAGDSTTSAEEGGAE